MIREAAAAVGRACARGHADQVARRALRRRARASARRAGCVRRHAAAVSSRALATEHVDHRVRGRRRRRGRRRSSGSRGRRRRTRPTRAWARTRTRLVRLEAASRPWRRGGRRATRRATEPRRERRSERGAATAPGAVTSAASDRGNEDERQRRDRIVHPARVDLTRPRSLRPSRGVKRSRSVPALATSPPTARGRRVRSRPRPRSAPARRRHDRPLRGARLRGDRG